MNSSKKFNKFHKGKGHNIRPELTDLIIETVVDIQVWDMKTQRSKTTNGQKRTRLFRWLELRDKQVALCGLVELGLEMLQIESQDVNC